MQQAALVPSYQDLSRDHACISEHVLCKRPTIRQFLVISRLIYPVWVNNLQSFLLSRVIFCKQAVLRDEAIGIPAVLGHIVRLPIYQLDHLGYIGADPGNKNISSAKLLEYVIYK